MDNPYEWLQNFIAQVPDILQPVIVALAGAIPYIEGEGAAAFGIIAGINPVVAAVAGATGNVLSVLAWWSSVHASVKVSSPAARPEPGQPGVDGPVVADFRQRLWRGYWVPCGGAAATAVVLEQVMQQKLR